MVSTLICHRLSFKGMITNSDFRTCFDVYSEVCTWLGLINTLSIFSHVVYLRFVTSHCPDSWRNAHTCPLTLFWTRHKGTYCLGKKCCKCRPYKVHCCEAQILVVEFSTREPAFTSSMFTYFWPFYSPSLPPTQHWLFLLTIVQIREVTLNVCSCVLNWI